MRRKLIIRSLPDNIEDAIIVDNFSLKKIVKSVGNAVGDAAKSVGKTVANVTTDAVKLGVQPVALAVSSVTGKPTNITMTTGVGKVVGALNAVGNKALTTTAKGFADTITGGLATKAANLVRKDEYKEKPFSYNEMKTQKGDLTGIRAIDKVQKLLPTIGTIAGGTAAGVIAGNKVLGGASNQKPTNVTTGGPITPVLPADTSVKNPVSTLPGGLPLGAATTPTQGGPKLASFGGFDITPMHIGIVLVVIVLLIIAAKKK